MPAVVLLAPTTSYRDADFIAAAERLGYPRFWLAEPHNMPGTASAATAVVIAHVAAGTRWVHHLCARVHLL